MTIRNILLLFRERDRVACGYDFGVINQPEWAIEVKGLKEIKGNIQFTDREWNEARIKQENYWLVVIGNMSIKPVSRIIRNPHTLLSVRSTYRQSIIIEWHSTISVA